MAPSGAKKGIRHGCPFTWLHLLEFCAIGGFASYLFECGFVFASQMIAESVLDALAWPAVLMGNLLAATAMAAVLWRRHPWRTILA